MKTQCVAATLLIIAQTTIGDLDGSGALLRRTIRAEVKNGFSGAVLVTHGPIVVIDAVYGSEHGVPMSADARFWIASVGKQFASAAILKCQENGWLSLTDPLEKFFRDVQPDKRGITIFQLLTHTSGFGQSYASEGAADRDAAVQRMLSEKLVDSPGHQFHYSNNNYQLAVAIVEVVSGRDYHAFVHDELWRPSGLLSTGFSGEPEARKVALAHGDTPSRLLQRTWGGEGVFSTTHDLLRWYRALRAGRVLSAQSVDRLFAPVTQIQEGAAALGWFVGKTDRGATRIFTRGNEDFGANALVYVYPSSDIVIIVLTHAGYATSETSWSRFVMAKIEEILSL